MFGQSPHSTKASSKARLPEADLFDANFSRHRKPDSPARLANELLARLDPTLRLLEFSRERDYGAPCQ